MIKNAMTKKVLVLGIDGMDPDLTKAHLAEGIMPNLEKLIAKGAAREDLHMLGSHPTITPPMWTTLATGAHPYTHGITDFWRQNPEKLDTYGYNLDSTLCAAEQIWNVTAEAGLKTLVFHWPGSSWPPTSENPNLMVVDGTNPEGVNMGNAQVDTEYIAVCSNELISTTFKKGVGESNMMCVVTDLEEKKGSDFDMGEFMHFMGTAPEIRRVSVPREGPSVMGARTFDLSLAPIKEASGWGIEVPGNAKETSILFSKGLVRRPALVLANEQGEYDTVVLYKSKKADEPLAVLKKDEFVQDVIDEAIKKDVKYTVNRNMKLIDIEPDGSKIRIWISAGTDITDDRVWWPQSLFNDVTSNVGYPQPVSNLGAEDAKLIQCMQENWWKTCKWYADAINYIIDSKDVDVIFSHMHNIDAQEHMFLDCCKENTPGPLPTEHYMNCLRDISKQADYYIGRFLHLLDKDWTIILTSDHGLSVLPIEGNPLATTDIDTTYMLKWGFTALKKDENGKYLPEIDWANTKAIKTRMNEIYINLKGKYPTGCVDPADKWELEEEIITKLYEYKHPKTGKRMISLAVRNKDAVHMGLGGAECGDIIFWTADDYTSQHGGGLSTTIGLSNTSQSPIFVAAGSGIKEGFKTTRVIREIDVAPTVSALLGVRMPRECEGAPVYQIFVEEM